MNSGGLEREVASEAFLSVVMRSPFFFIRGNAFFNLSFLADVPLEALLVVLCIPCQVQLQPRLGPPDSLPTQLGSIPILMTEYLSLVPVSVRFPLSL